MGWWSLVLRARCFPPFALRRMGHPGCSAVFPRYFGPKVLRIQGLWVVVFAVVVERPGAKAPLGLRSRLRGLKAPAPSGVARWRDLKNFWGDYFPPFASRRM